MRKRLLAWTLVGSAALGAGAAEAKRDCCFANVAYAGGCRVTPAEGETCASILNYLNTPNSAGRTYCTSTAIRGGWKKKSCEAKPKEGTAEERLRPAARLASHALGGSSPAR